MLHLSAEWVVGYRLRGGRYVDRRRVDWVGRSGGLQGNGCRSYRGVLEGVVGMPNGNMVHFQVYLVCQLYRMRRGRLFAASARPACRVLLQAFLATCFQNANDGLMWECTWTLPEKRDFYLCLDRNVKMVGCGRPETGSARMSAKSGTFQMRLASFSPQDLRQPHLVVDCLQK